MNPDFTEIDLRRMLEKSKMSTIKIEAKPDYDLSGRFSYLLKELELPITTSKFLGEPYFPKGADYPLDKNNEPMILLAQINFAEVPPLENFPETGILQFYIAVNDDLYGANFDDLTDQSSFRVIFHAIVNENIARKDLPRFDRNENYTPINAEYRLSFTPSIEVVPSYDYRFKHYFGEDYYDFIRKHENDELWEKYEEIANASGHKMGGYAYFTQYDPRNNEIYSDYILLFQIDSGEAICWGDVGVGNWFIREEDLKKRDFTKVLYNWDCS